MTTCSLAFVVMCAGVDLAEALPSGRSWAATQDIIAPGIESVRGARLEVDSTGGPLFVTQALRAGRTEEEWAVIGWRDSAWAARVFTGVRADNIPEPVLSLIPGQFLVWFSTVEYSNGYAPILFSQLLPEPTPPETVTATPVEDSEYGAAVSGQRRWVARSEQRPGTFVDWVRVLYSDTAAVWHELPAVGTNDGMCTIAPLSGHSAIVAYSDGPGLDWSVADGDHWVASGNLDPGLSLPPIHPRFRFRPSGGLWLMWADLQHVHVASFRDGVWDRGDSTTCVHAPGETYWSAWNDMSRDSSERPVLAWVDLGVGYTYTDVGCVAFPTETGWAPGEEVPGSRGLFLSPKVTRDRNGDAWLVWDLRGRQITRFTHTYVSATTSTPTISGSGRERTLRWTLSEHAPESWWVVLRSRRGGPFEEATRLRADGGLDMSWVDESPPGGHLSYKIRRESVDSRYGWESREAFWPVNIKKPPHISTEAPGRPVRQADRSVALQIEDADPGPVEVTLYDLQGRQVLWQHATSSGGKDSIRLELGSAERPVTPGIYFVIARDAGARQSDALKIVVLR
jgi:hypothetical protein